MNNIFGENGFVYRVVNKLVDLLVLNVIYIVSCLPIITIGAANTALYTLTLKMCKNQEGYIFREYWKTFRMNLKKSTVIWCIFLALFVLLGIDFWIVFSLSFSDSIRKVMQVLLCAVFLLAVMIFSYVFPLIAVFENTIQHYLKNAVIISMTRIGYTIIIVILNMIPLMFFLFGGKWLTMALRVFVLVGWAMIAYLNSFLLNKVFERYK